MPIDQHHTEYLTTHTHGRLATIAPNGTPQNKPVGYRYDPGRGTIEIAGFNMEQSAKYRNLAVNPDVSFVVDDIVGEGAAGVRFIELRGQGEQADKPADGPPDGLSSHIIRIYPRRLVSWNIHPDHPGMYTENLTLGEERPAENGQRPVVGLTGPQARAGARAVEAFVAELQKGFEQRDADISNRHFATDVIWGSPFGATLLGYEQLHAIHMLLKRRGVGGPASRYEILQTLTPAPGVVVAHVRRVALDDSNPILDANATNPGSRRSRFTSLSADGEPGG